MQMLKPSHKISDSITAGFTLVEVLVVLAIISLASIVLVSSVNLEQSNDRSLSINIKADLDKLRNTAVLLSKPQQFNIDDDRLKYEAAIDKNGALIFYPDGSSTGGRVLNDNGDIILEINWRNGDVYNVS